jgi:hypothetical protein
VDDIERPSLTEAAREAYMQLVTCELPDRDAGAQAWVPVMRVVSRVNASALYPALVAIADQLEAGFHDAVRTQDPSRLHSAFTDAARRLKEHAGAGA